MPMRNLCLSLLALVAAYWTQPLSAADGDVELRRQAEAALKTAATYYRNRVAKHGGYVYYYSPDLSRRLGEGVAGPEEIWVQPPGTPTVGLAYLAAFRATGEPFYLAAAREAATALMHGQLQSGGWTASIDFDPRGPRVAQFRGSQAHGRNNSTLDDGITQTALRFLAQADQALEFKDQ